MIRAVAVRAILFLLIFASWLPGQEMRITVWQPANAPASDVRVTVTRALNLAAARNYLERLPAAAGTNEYARNLAGAPALVDVLIEKTGYHTLTLRDLSVAADRNQLLHVQLLPVNVDYRAPECFSFKSQYEFLFRKEQQLATPEEQGLPADQRRARAAQRARLKYADSILTLPNPNRPPRTQSPGTLRMLEQMGQQDQDGYEELGNMMKGLFDLYDMQGTDNFTPSTWNTTFGTPMGGQRSCTVELSGTKGSYTTEDGRKHALEQVDIAPVFGDEGFYYEVTGIWRYQGRGGEERGPFRWKIDENNNRFTGLHWHYGQERAKRPWNGELVRGAYD